jgi:hypothetical protein
MKKTVITILFLLFTINIFAQENGPLPYGFRLGLTAHPNFGFIKAENGKGNGVALGFSYGLMGDFNFAENYSFATGITVTTINGKSTEINPTQFAPANSPTATAYDLKYKMQYLEIPLTIKLKTSEINGVRWYGQFGLSNGIKLSAKQDAETGGTGVANDINAGDWTRLYRAGMIIGGGGEFKLSGKSSLLLGLTYNNGFTNISSTGSNVRNHYVGINFGVFF